jgi:multidrug resistance efflux pump
MQSMKRIPVPWKHRWQRFRYTTLPMLGFFAFLFTALWLWTRAGEMPHAIGEVEAVRVNVASDTGGILMPLPRGDWTLYEKVERDQIIARLDDRLLRAQMTTVEKDVDRLKKELESTAAKLAVSEADRERGHRADLVRLQVELEQRRILALDRKIQAELDRMEEQRTGTYLECIQPLYEKKMISEQELSNARIYHEEAVKRLAENIKIAGEAELQQKEAEERLKGMPDFVSADAATELAPIRAEIDVEQTRIGEFKVQIERLTIRSPISGMICAIYHWPNETVPAGDPIVTVASDQTRYIVSYVRQEQHIEPKAGMAVDLRKRAVVSSALQTKVERVGPQIELIPLHLCRDPKIPEWGLPVRITLPENFSGHPGELFEVTFKTQPQDDG